MSEERTEIDQRQVKIARQIAALRAVLPANKRAEFEGALKYWRETGSGPHRRLNRGGIVRYQPISCDRQHHIIRIVFIEDEAHIEVATNNPAALRRTVGELLEVFTEEPGLLDKLVSGEGATR